MSFFAEGKQKTKRQTEKNVGVSILREGEDNGNLPPLPSSDQLLTAPPHDAERFPRISFSFSPRMSLPPTAMDRELKERMNIHSTMNISRLNAIEAAPSALKKEQGAVGAAGAPKSVVKLDTRVMMGDDEEEEEEGEGQVTGVGLPKYDPKHPGALFAKLEEARLEKDGRTHLQSLDSAATARPPWWIRRWSELWLFLNSTWAHADPSCNTLVDATINQLDSDVVAAQALEQFVAEDRNSKLSGFLVNRPDRVVGVDEEGELPPLLGNGETSSEKADDGAMLAQIVPPWLCVGSGKRLTHQLSEVLSARLKELLDGMRSDTDKAAMRLLGVPDSGGFDGTQCSFLSPVVLRLHASIVRKSILMDVFASQQHLYKKRAKLISDGFRTQTPLIHADYITNEDIRPVYDPATLQPLRMNGPPAADTKETPQRYSSFVIFVDYIRFKPSETTATQRTSDLLCAKPTPSFFHKLLGKDESFSSNLPGVSVGNQNDSFLVSFTREDHLISKILDNYEQYRMIKLNLLPHLKSRHFYRDQLANFARQSHLTEEMKELKESLLQLLNLTSELELVYLKTMLSAWKDIAQLRGEDPNGCFVTSSRSNFNATLSKDTDISPLSLMSRNKTFVDAKSRRGFVGLSEGPVSLLSEGQKLQTLSSDTRFRMYMQATRSNGAEGLFSQENNLLDYTPVIEGLDPATGASQPGCHNREVEFNSSAAAVLQQSVESPAFQVLVFVRTSTAMPPQLVGSTAPRTPNASKVLFFKETFEFCTKREPQEILLHIVSVKDSVGDCVVASVSVPPSFTQAHSLLSLQAPISFMYNGGTHVKRGRINMPGVISLSTTWTVTQGMTIEEIEALFLHGDADPMDPQYNSLLNILKGHYMGSIASTTTVSPREDVSLPTLSEAVVKVTTRTHEIEEKSEAITSQLFSPEVLLGTERLRLLRQRWLFSADRVAPKDEVEARLFSQPVPLEDTECHKLKRRIKHAYIREKHGMTPSIYSDALICYAAGGGLLSTLSLGPLSRTAKLQLWQERLRSVKTNSVSFRKLEDHELLERHVILPRLRALRGIHLTPQRQLNPRREERPKTDDINRVTLASKQDSRIVVHIMKATALPQRSDGTPLEPFVEVSFAYETLISRSEVGTAPSWFETLNIPFLPPDFDDKTLSLIEDDIVISVYDKLEIQMAPSSLTTGAVSCETHYRTERRLLGTLRVPFFTLYQADQARTEGQFPLSTPRWVLGYFPNEVYMGSCMTLTRSRRGASCHSRPSIQLYIALWPPLQHETRRELDQATISRLITQSCVSEQLQHLHEMAMKWRRDALKRVKSLSSVNPVAQQRKIEPFVFCTTGDLTLVCRYLLANGGPPPLTVTTVGEAIRFVSLLLFRIDTVTWGGDDVWSTNAELLHAREGDYEEFSLLLVHFLRYLAPHEVTFLVTGRGNLYENVVMVLHSFDGELRLIDPRTGWVCPVHDPHLVLFRDVHMVVSHDQLWANIQLSGTPHRMDWNLHDKRFWLPCFDHGNSNVGACLPYISPLQREMLAFEMPDRQQEQKIEQQLRKAVFRALVEWRNNRKPALHHGVVPILQTLLREAEEELSQCAGVRRDAVTMRASELLNEYFGDDVLKEPQWRRHSASDEVGESGLPRSTLRIMGSPVNAAYRPDDVTYQDILLQVFETAVHEVGTSAVSFAIGVYVKGYTSEVYSMWVFVLALYEVAALTLSEAPQ